MFDIHSNSFVRTGNHIRRSHSSADLDEKQSAESSGEGQRTWFVQKKKLIVNIGQTYSRMTPTANANATSISQIDREDLTIVGQSEKTATEPFVHLFGE